MSPRKEEEMPEGEYSLTQHAIIALLTDQGAEIDPGGTITKAELREDPAGHKRVFVTIREPLGGTPSDQIR